MVKLRMVCGKCGSEAVLADAFAEWDYDKQEWVINNVFDKGAYCNQCDEATRIEEIEETVAPAEDKP